MSRRIRSRFVFETTLSRRTFRHLRYMNNVQVAECQTCRNHVQEHEPYSHHWLGSPDVQHIQLDPDEKQLIQRIDGQRIETFLLCDGSAVSRTNSFLLEAGMEAVPELLRFLIFGASRLEVSFGFYVNVTKNYMFHESTPVIISNHLDIKETVDMVFSILLEKIASYVLVHYRLPLDACTIKRIKVIAKRLKLGIPQVPLQYRVKCSANRLDTKSSSRVDIALLSESYARYHGHRYGKFLAPLTVNLYCLRVCATTRELFAVPYLLRSQDVTNTPTFLILTNVAGDLQGMHEIRDVKRFLKEDSMDHLFECRKCKTHFSDRSQFALHKQIDCGTGFMVWQIDQEKTEFHENCLMLSSQHLKFSWFAIIN